MLSTAKSTTAEAGGWWAALGWLAQVARKRAGATITLQSTWAAVGWERSPRG